MKESKINAGKETIISKLKKQSKEDQLADNQREMDGAKEEEITYTRLCTYINNLLTTREIDRFKQMRQKAYYTMLKAFALCEKEIALAEHELWARAS